MNKNTYIHLQAATVEIPPTIDNLPVIEVPAINAQAPLVIEVPAIDALPSLTSTSVDASSQRDQNFEYDLGEFLMKPKDLTKHYVPNVSDQLFKKTIHPKDGNPYTLTYQTKWLRDDKRPWHVYSYKLSGGLCKACVLFDEKNKTTRGVFVKTAYQNISRQDKIHENTEYHQKAIEAAEIFIRGYENPDSNVDFEKQKAQNYDTNLHIIQRIVEAVLLCAEQGLALRGHRDHHRSESEESCCERSFGRGNFLAILDAFAKMDPTFKII